MKKYLLLLIVFAPSVAWSQTDSLNVSQEVLTTTTDSLAIGETDSLLVETADSIPADAADTIADGSSEIGETAVASDTATSTKTYDIESEVFDSKKIRWGSPRSYALNAADSLVASYRIETANGNEIKLIGSKREWVFKIESRNGSFESIKNNGKVKFNVTLNGTPGIIEMKRHKETVSFVIDFREASETGLYREFIINQTETF